MWGVSQLRDSKSRVRQDRRTSDERRQRTGHEPFSGGVPHPSDLLALWDLIHNRSSAVRVYHGCFEPFDPASLMSFVVKVTLTHTGHAMWHRTFKTKRRSTLHERNRTSLWLLRYGGVD